MNLLNLLWRIRRKNVQNITTVLYRIDYEESENHGSESLGIILKLLNAPGRKDCQKVLIVNRDQLPRNLG